MESKDKGAPEGLTSGDLGADNHLDPASAQDPFALFATWMSEASSTEVNDPDAMALATADSDGMPNVRMVLLKGVDAEGFVFYTNLESAKGQEIAANPKAALCFHWKSLRRQVRVRGNLSPVTSEEADAYYHSRARGSRLGAWASKQSRPLESRFALEKEVAKVTARYPVGDIPRPPYWSGFRLTPLRIEFWRDQPFRLHDRLVFTREEGAQGWATSRLYP